MANEQLNQLSQRWQKEVEAVAKEAETMYKNYQNEMVFLTDDQKKKREADIVAKEKRGRAASEILRPRRRALQKRQTLMRPIQEDVYNAIKKYRRNEAISAYLTAHPRPTSSLPHPVSTYPTRYSKS